jgi:hypothetical protein
MLRSRFPLGLLLLASRNGFVLAALWVGSAAPSPAMAQSPQAPDSSAAQPAKPQSSQPTGKPAAQPAKPAGIAVGHRYQPDRFAGRAGSYYRLLWGVDSLGVKLVESGEVVRFTYHVLDANKAQALNDKKNEPILIDASAGVSLVVPSMEKIGKLRQSSTPEAGKSYWMAFSNKGRPVKRGDRVTVQIGQFRADGLVVD